jgi:Uma2 family endonuclease
MAAPGSQHQRILVRLTIHLGNFLKKYPCELFVAPFDVRLVDGQKSLKAGTPIHTVIQPDLCVVCDPLKIDEKGCLGAPDMMVEILSPGNSKKEMSFKKQLYEENDIDEYWIFDPIYEIVFRFDLDKTRGVYGRPEIFSSHQILESIYFPNLKIDLKEIFNK